MGSLDDCSDHVPSFLPNPWNWQGNALLHCARLHLVLWDELHSFNSFLDHLRNTDVDDLFNDALSIRTLVLGS